MLSSDGVELRALADMILSGCFLAFLFSALAEPFRDRIALSLFIARLHWCTKYSCSRVLVICAVTHNIINFK